MSPIDTLRADLVKARSQYEIVVILQKIEALRALDTDTT